MNVSGGGRAEEREPLVVDDRWNADALLALVHELRDEYLAASPWPHVLIRDLFPADLLRRAEAEVRSMDSERMAVTASRTIHKREVADTALAGPATAAVLALLDAPAMLSFIAGITGIPDLQADPEHFWAGVHETPDGGFTMVHTDFLEHPETGLHHRTNSLLYLNEGWQASWGGNLELWPRAMDRLGRSIVPEFNTLVVFATGASTMHGLPEPVHAPDGRSRVSLASYHYSTNPSQDTERAGFSKYRRRPGDGIRIGIPSKWDVKERVPEPVRRSISRVRRRFRGVP